MAEKRRLPVLQSAPAQTPPTPAQDAPADEPPPWHWVPLGALISIAVGAVFARSFYVPFSQRALERVYGNVQSPEHFRRIDAALSSSVRDALHFKLAVAGFVVAMVSVLIGGFVVARFGARTNQRHGTLSGLCTMVLLVLLIGRGAGLYAFLGYLTLIPFGGLAGFLGGVAGMRLKLRAASGH